MLNLYLLEQIDGAWYDEVEGFVISAKSPAGARRLAGKHAWDEGSETWYRPAKSSCKLIGTTTGLKPEVILRATNNG